MMNMLDSKKELGDTIYTVKEIPKADALEEATEILNNADITIEQTGYDNWNQNDAKTEEQYQVVGLLSRETIITLASSFYKRKTSNKRRQRNKQNRC